jgi:hypothetical protein
MFHRKLVLMTPIVVLGFELKGVIHDFRGLTSHYTYYTIFAERTVSIEHPLFTTRVQLDILRNELS